MAKIGDDVRKTKVKGKVFVYEKKREKKKCLPTWVLGSLFTPPSMSLLCFVLVGPRTHLEKASKATLQSKAVVFLDHFIGKFDRRIENIEKIRIM